MVVDRTSPTYPSRSSCCTNSIAGAWRACNPTTVRSPCLAASSAIARASSRSRPRGHSQYTALPAASAAETSSRWCGTLTVTATTSMSDRVTRASWSENTAPTPKASPAARADSALRELRARVVKRHDARPIRLRRGRRPSVAGGDRRLQGIRTQGAPEPLSALERLQAPADEQAIPARSILIEQQDGLAGRPNSSHKPRGLDLHERDNTMDFRLGWRELGKDAAQP